MRNVFWFILVAVVLTLALVVCAFAVYGDIYKDGKVNANDAVKLAQKLANWNIEFTAEDEKNADVFCDGVLNAADAVKLAQFLAGWDVQLGPKGEDVEIDGDDLFDETTGEAGTTAPVTTAPAPDTTVPEDTTTTVPEPEPEPEPDDEPYWNYSRGVNINGLEGTSKYNDASNNLKNLDTLKDIKNQGFDHIRVPVDFRNFYNSSTGTLNESKMALIDTAIDNIIGLGMGVMLDFHVWYEFDPTSASDTATFKAIWKLVAERYKDESSLLMFELMNEPHYKSSTSRLINFQMEVVDIIRATGGYNDKRLILIAGPDSNQPWKLPEVNIPAGDENLVMVVHLYNPGEFTHQGCTWANPSYTKQVRLTDDHKSTVRWDLSKIKEFIDRTGMRVVVNEVGMNVELADPADTDTYIRMISQFCTDNDIPLAWWGYDSDAFALYEDNAGWGQTNNYWRTELLDALFLK